MVESFRSPYFAVNELPGLPILRVVRSRLAFASLEELSEAWDALNRALDQMGRERFSVLIDMRLATGRNDSAFEAAFDNHRKEVQRDFLRVAVVVSSPAGRLQVQRHATKDRVTTRAFADVADAIAWLRNAGSTGTAGSDQERDQVVRAVSSPRQE